jgi:hypothetical protein
MKETFNPYKIFNGSFIPDCISEIPDKELDSLSKLVLGRLQRYAGKNGLCTPKRATLAREVGTTVSTLDKKLKNLRDYGLIKTIQRGARRSNSYQFLWHEVYEKGGYESPKLDGQIEGELSDMTRLGLSNSATLNRRESVEENILYKYTLPTKFGNDSNKRIINFYSKLWERKFNLPYKANFGKFGKIIKNLGLTEIQICALILIYFSWSGIDGNNPKEYKSLEQAGFPVEWITSRVNQMKVYLKTLGVDFENQEQVFEFVVINYGSNV